MWSQRHGTGVGFRAARALGKVVLTTANQERGKGAGSNRTLGRYNLQIQGRYGMHRATSLKGAPAKLRSRLKTGNGDTHL